MVHFALSAKMCPSRVEDDACEHSIQLAHADECGLEFAHALASKALNSSNNSIEHLNSGTANLGVEGRNATTPF